MSLHDCAGLICDDPVQMSQANPSTEPPRYAELVALLRLWPLHLILLLALCLLGGPVWRAARVAYSGGAEGGVQVDTAGASGRQSGGRYVLDLPVDIVNRGGGMVLGVSLWVDTYACPDTTSRLRDCRRLTAFEQYMPLRLAPGSAESASQQMDGIAPGPDEVIRIERKLQAIEDGPSRADG